MPKFRKKPVEVEARRYDLATGAEIAAWVQDLNPAKAATIGKAVFDDTGLWITTTEGVMHVAEGDWVIRGTQGEFYPCKPLPFADTFELVEG